MSFHYVGCRPLENNIHLQCKKEWESSEPKSCRSTADAAEKGERLKECMSVIDSQWALMPDVMPSLWVETSRPRAVSTMVDPEKEVNVCWSPTRSDLTRLL